MIPDLLRRAAGNAVAGDPYYSAVSLLLHFNGANGSTTFTDSSVLSSSFTTSGSPQISTAQSKFGGAAGYFASSSSSYISTTSGSILAFGSGDFTVEAWIYLNDTNANATKGIVAGVGSNCFGFRVGQSFQGNVNGLGIYRDQVADCEYCSFTFSANTWYHVAVVRSSSTISFYINGTKQTTLGSGAATFSYPTPTTVRAGATNPNAEYFNGYIDDLRITPNVARYTANFTVPSAPYPDRIGSIEADAYFPQTSLLLHMDGTNGSTSFVDSGPNALAVTASGNAQISTAQSKFGGAAGYFDGTGDWLTSPYRSDWRWSDSSITIEAWVYASSWSGWSFLSTEQPMMVGQLDASQGNYWGFGPLGNGTVQFYYWIGSKQTVTTTSTLNTNQWNHIAFTYTASTLRIFINGILSASGSISGTPQYSATLPLSIGGANQQANNINGYIDDLRITKSARYTSNFTPRAKAFPDLYNPYKTPPVSGAALWLAGDDSSSLFTDAGVTPVKVNGDLVYQWNDKSGNSRHATQTTSGNRPTWVPPASGRNGLGALAFNGSSQWVSLASGSHFAFGTGDYTIECWINLANTSSQQTFFVSGISSNVGNWGGYFTGTKFDIYNNGQGPQKFSGNCTVSANTWYHFAVTRSSGTTRVFLNGSQVSSGTDTYSYTSTGGARIAHDGISGYPLNAKIQNLIVYNGQAIYTSNFTPWMS